GVMVVARREGGIWEAGDDHGHGHDHGKAGKHDDHKKAGEHAGHDHHGADPHIWLDPHNAGAIALQVAEHLSVLDPGHAETYRRNAGEFTAELEALEARLEAVVKPVAGRKYVVFHDAYRYFEDHFGLKPAGAVTLNPDSTPGAAQVLEIAELIRTRGAVCLFAEPQFEPRLVRRLAEGGEVRVGVLDPLGADLEPGPALYPALMTRLAEALAACLR
ncbi:MAG: zinc ABC transporter substrate-binding protein, partial [Rhodospirillales bacterium]